MLLPTPWNPRSVALLLGRLGHVPGATPVCPVTDSTGEVVILKPPVTKFDVWQPLAVQLAVPIGRWLDSCVTSDGTPYQADPVWWQVAHDSALTAVCPVDDSSG